MDLFYVSEKNNFSARIIALKIVFMTISKTWSQSYEFGYVNKKNVAKKCLKYLKKKNFIFFLWKSQTKCRKRIPLQKYNIFIIK